ncbi:protein toll-like [Argiope bruennichi]|uniref:protein toll-like n=1 Tax=Argiope bruennichi TaxID=94029 RepID=UPI0024940B78|nr:protein toll-like [Argiope bruennichi]
MESAKRRRGNLYILTSENNYWREPFYRQSSNRSNRRYFRTRNDNRHSQDSGNFMLCVVFVLFCLFSLNSGNLPHEADPSEDEPFPSSECETLLPECECDDYGGVAGLICQNVSDFDAFTKTLGDGSLFENGTTYEITLSGTRILPRQFLKGLIVFRLYIDDPQTALMEDGAFEGVLRLKRFHVRISSIKEIPDFSPIRNSLMNLYMDNSLLTAVDGDQLKNLKLLETLSFVNNSIRYVAPDAFQGTENLIIFDMSNNFLQFLPPNLFDPMKKLKKAVLSNNYLMHVNQVFAVTHPRFIYLDHNNLTNLDAVLHRNMIQVETVQLSYNPFTNVTMNSFNGKLVRARFLYLDHCLIKEFNVKHYISLNNLSTLDLSFNFIEKVVNQTISFGKDVELDFTGNKITEFDTVLLYNVKRVYLDKNLMTTLGRTLQFSQMAQVQMADNRITSLEYEEFRGVHGIMVLDLQGNLISSIERETFTSIRKDLVYLDLSRNRIRKLNGCVQALSLLTSLNLTNNQIEGFEIGEFHGLNELTDLYLQGNRIKTLGYEVQGLTRLKNLVISYNRIRTIKGDQLPPSLQYVYVEGNPLWCDCQLLPFLQHLNSTKTLKTDVPLCSPSNDSLIESPARCPDGCRCFCTNSGGNHYISVDCSSIGLTQLPPLFSAANSSAPEHNSTSLVIFLNRNMEENAFFSVSATIVIQDEMGGLDFSDNNLQSVEDARLPEGTKYLLLAHNLLRQPPTSLLYSLEELNTVTLSDNPWACDCGTTGFKRWILSHSDSILDVNETRCGPDGQDSSGLANRAIWSLSDIDLCPTDIETYISVSIGVLSFFLVAAAMTIAWTRYELNIKVWLYAHGVTMVKERDIDRDKVFDAFISFSYKDQNLVIPDIINVIQKKMPNVRLCLHYRDFCIGDLIEENIVRAVQCSKRTVLVLSRNFLESEWCMFEFKAAHVQALKDRVNRIIIIKLGDLPKESEMPQDIQIYLKSTTYLTWGDKYFWDNLLYCLPTSSSPRPTTTVDMNGQKTKYPVLV